MQSTGRFRWTDCLAGPAAAKNRTVPMHGEGDQDRCQNKDADLSVQEFPLGE